MFALPPPASTLNAAQVKMTTYKYNDASVPALFDACTLVQRTYKALKCFYTGNKHHLPCTAILKLSVFRVEKRFWQISSQTQPKMWEVNTGLRKE